MRNEKKLLVFIGIFVVIGLLVLPSLSWADDFVLNGYTEVGKRSTAEDYEEEDTDDDYTYYHYHLKLEQEVSDWLSYDISTFIYDKDYKSKDSLDNISRIFKTRWAYYLRKDKEESLRFAFKLKYKEKLYNNTPASEYEQITAEPSFTFTKKDLYAVYLSAGIDNFDYLETGEKDQFKILGKIGGDRYFLDRKLMFTSSYKIETTEQKKINRERTRHDIMGGFDYTFDIPWVYKIITRANWGQRDTKEEDERDEDYDYEYWDHYIRTEHRITPKLATNLKYQFFKKDYITADLDHRGFSVKNNWEYEILDDKIKRITLDLAGEHKDVEYSLKTGNDYRKETAEIKTTYQKKNRWKTSISLQGNSYDYNESSDDKRRYYVLVSGEKLFKDGDIVLSIDFKYRYTDYERNDDGEQEAVRVAFGYKF